MKTFSQFCTATAVLGAYAILVSLAAVNVCAACLPPPAGIVGWWPAEGNATDVIGTNSGLLENVAFTNGLVGQAFYLNGTNSAVQIPGSASLKPANITVEAWVKFDVDVTPNASLPGQQIIVFTLNSRDPASGSFTGYCLLKNGNQFAFVIGSPSGDQVFASGTTVPQVGVWYHVAGTYDSTSGSVSIYVNGVLEGSAYAGFPLDYGADTPVLIGTSGEWFDGKLEGAVDEVSIYDRALSTNEIAAIYHAGSAGKCAPAATTNDCVAPPAGLVSWWGGENNASDVAGANPGLPLNITYASGEVGQAFVFDGSSSEIRVPASPSLNVGQGSGLTVEAWVNPADLSLQELCEWNQNNGVPAGADQIGAHMEINESPGDGSFWGNLVDTAGTSHAFNSGTNLITINGFQHLAMTYDKVSGVGVLYRNGSAVATANLGTFTPQTSFDLFLGNRPSGFFTGIYFHGEMDEPTLYNRALSAAEIQSIYAAGSAGKCTSTLVGSTGVPAIFNFSPTAGTNGAVVAIAGTNFSANTAANIVYFGAVRANVLAASANSLMVTVPAGATLAPLTVTVSGLTAYSSSLFLPTYSGAAQLTSGSLSAPVNLTAGSGPARVVVGDLDGDGKPDVVVANVYDGSVWIYRNLSTNGPLAVAALAPPIIFTIGGGNDSLYGLALADLDGDGRLDIITANRNLNIVSIFQNLSSAGSLTTNSFAARVDLPVAGSPSGLAVMDLDGDGRPEIVTANQASNSVSVLQNLGAPGSLTTNSFGPALSFVSGSGAFAVAIADIDGDGQPDLITANNPSASTVSVLRNTSSRGNISFAPEVDFPGLGSGGSVAVADLDGDGKLDVVCGSSSTGQAVSVYRNTSTPGSITTNSLAPNVDFAAGGWANTVAIGDLDGDGKPDLVVDVQLPSQLSIFKNTSTPGSLTASSFGPRLDFAAGWNPNGIAVADLDGDGRPDITFGNDYDSTIAIYQNQTPFGTTLPPSPPTILSQSPNQIVLLGHTATFAISVSGTEPLSYFWSRDGGLIPNATNSSYILSGAQLSDSGSTFSCFVTNAFGSATSSNMALKVIDSTIANDLCSGAILITNANCTNSQSTVAATSFGDPVPDCINGFGHGVWYQFTAPVAGWLSVDTFGSDFDTGLALYTGSCDSLVEVACNDDAGGVTSQVTLRTTAGTTYFILAGGYAADAGALVLHLNHLTPPAFAIQPANTAVVVSSNAIFRPTMSGTLPMTFQWYFNGAPLVDDGRIVGAANSTLTIANVQTNDGGNYQLVASNSVGVTTSSVAVLTPIILPPTITTPPLAQAVVVGSNANFFVVVEGTPPYSYQWAVNGNTLVDDGVHIAGSTTSSLNISNLTAADAGSYSVIVTNLSGAATAAATLVVMTPPVITSQPIGRSVPPGLPTTFNASASGVPAPFYQWQFNGTNLPGWSSVGSNTIPAVGTNNLGFYSVVASNSLGSVTSAVAQLTFGPIAAWGLNTLGQCLPPPGLSNVFAVAGSPGGFAVRADGTLAAWGAGLITNVPASASNVVAISVSAVNAAYALRNDGTVVSWNGPAAPALSNVVAVAAGFNFALGLRNEGTVAGWGTLPFSAVPPGLNQVTAIAAGYSHSLALRSDGTVVAWGAGAATNVPAGLTDVTAIAAGYLHSLALKANGTVVAWGAGTGTNLPAGLTHVVAISSENSPANALSLALRVDGTVVAWGDNPYGETNPPAALGNLRSVAIAAAPNHGLALVNDGSPQLLHPPVGLTAFIGRDVTLQATAVGAAPLSYQWLLNGTNVPGATNTTLFLPNLQFANAGNYQLFVSNAVNTALSLPAPVTVLSNHTLTFLSQTTGGATNYQASKIMVGSVTVLGNGPLSYQWFASPTNKNYTAVSGATNDTLVLDPALAWQSGNYYVAVSNGFVQPPYQTSALTSAPVNVRILFARAWGFNAVTNPPVNVTNAVAVATGGTSGNSSGLYLALGADGKVTPWANYPTIYGETNVSALSNSFVTAISAGYESALALKSDGTVYAWGNGGYAQTNSPANLSGVVAIACGGYHDLALKSDGTVVGWGGSGPQVGQQFNYGQATNNPAATNVVAIAAGNLHSLALRADGSVVAWGYSFDGTTTVPASATNVIGIAAGSSLSAVLRANGTVVEWGNGILNYPVPISLNNLSNVVAISASGAHVTALRNDGTVVSWGSAYSGVASNYVPADLAYAAAIASGGDHDLALFGTRAPAFTIQPWNRTVFNTATSVWFSAKCAGAQPVTYQWRLNGTNIPAATNDTLTVRSALNGQFQPLPLASGVYQLIASNAYGAVASKYAKLTVQLPLGVALNATNLNWTTTGNAPWFGQTNYAHDGVASARSGGIGAAQQSILQTTLTTNVAGIVSFWWKVSSEQFFDTLEFDLNGAAQSLISGEVDWRQASFPVSAGTNVLVWRYSKDPTFDAGLDAGFVDQFAFASAPMFLRQPASVTANYGATITLAVLATGSPTLGYQWTQNGNPVGGNSASLNLANVGRAQDGAYSVTVSNGGGAVVSSNAMVHVNIPQRLGSPVLLANGAFQLTSTDADGGLLSAADLANFSAQASTDLVNWVTLPNALSLTNGMLLLQDSGSNNAARYYRLLEH